jgi:hypothetical protein
MALGALSIPVTHPAPADLAAWLSGVSLAGLGRPVSAHPEWEREATGAARAWLRLVDEGRHTASWAAASSLLKEEVGPRGWDAALRAVRDPLGRCLSRTLRSRDVVEGPPGDLRGPYVVIRFDSVFEGRSPVAETITPVLGADGRWRVAAYFIR